METRTLLAILVVALGLMVWPVGVSEAWPLSTTLASRDGPGRFGLRVRAEGLVIVSQTEE